MNKTKSIYPTQIGDSGQENPLKDSFRKFSNRIDQYIKHTTNIKKVELVQQSNELHLKLAKIKEQSNKYKKKIFEEEQAFELKVQSCIKGDIGKWKEHQSFFRSHFEQLQENMKWHRARNDQYRSEISQKRQQLKLKMKEQRNYACEIERIMAMKKQLSQTIKVKPKQDGADLTTKQSTVHLSYSNSQNIRERVKTQSSLPSLKPTQRYNRIRTIQSQYEQQLIQRKIKANKVYSYMQSIGTIRSKQQSQLPLLIQLLRWFKIQEHSQDNWLLKVIFNKRHFLKLMNYLQEHSNSRKIVVKK